MTLQSGNARECFGPLSLGLVQLDQVTLKVKIQTAEQDARQKRTAVVQKCPAWC